MTVAEGQRVVEGGAAAALPLVLTVPKVDDQQNEDSYCRSLRGVHALSDGASISFDSANWSRMLVRRFVRDPDFSPEWLAAAIAEFSNLYERENLPWMKQAAFDQGSFASLLGVTLVERDDTVRIFAIGDSLAVLCDGDAIKATFPYSNAAQFDQAPRLLSTNPAENAFLAKLTADKMMTEWCLSDLARPALLCMTDALGHWLLSWKDRTRSPVAILRNLASQSDFARFVETERTAGRLRRDDTTLMAIW